MREMYIVHSQTYIVVPCEKLSVKLVYLKKFMMINELDLNYSVYIQ